MAKWLDENGLSHFWSKLKTLLNGKVDKVDGKGLSSNDYTANEKTKLAGIATQAQVNVIEAVTVDGKAQTITNKTVALNLSGYATDSELSSKADKTELNALTETVNGNSTLLAQAQDSLDSLSGQMDTKADQSDLEATNEEVAKKINSSDVEATYAKKSDITGVYKYKSSVAKFSDLPSTGNKVGDVYNVEERGMNYAWTGSAWDALGELFNIEAITTTEIDTICS